MFQDFWEDFWGPGAGGLGRHFRDFFGISGPEARETSVRGGLVLLGNRGFPGLIFRAFSGPIGALFGLIWTDSSAPLRKILVSVKFVSAILGPEMGAPILWTPGKMRSFCRKNHVRKIPLLWGGGFGGGGGGVPILFLWARGFFCTSQPWGEAAEIPSKGPFWAQLAPFGLSPGLLSPRLDFPNLIHVEET